VSANLNTGGRPHLLGVSIEITLWFSRQFNQHVIGRYVLSSFTICSAKCPVGTLWNNPGVSFKMWLTMCPPLWSQCDWWVHCDCFYNVPSQVDTGHILNVTTGCFHNIPSNVFIMCPVGSLQCNLNVLSMWPILPQTPKKIIDYVDRYIMNTLLGTLWKKPQWVAQVHAEHILLKIVKETFKICPVSTWLGTL